jgi:ATP-binding cassette subfamily B protein
VQQISVLWTNVQSAIAGSERIFDLLDDMVDLTDKDDAGVIPKINGAVRFDNVWAEYNTGEPVLKGIDIEAEPGKTLVIVAPPGTGKTTIINLLPLFWDVSQGQITDEVLVLDQVQSSNGGSHMDLLEAKGFYYNLYMSQFRRQVDDEEGADKLKNTDAFFVLGD